MGLENKGSVRNQYILTILANTPNLSYGILFGWLSPALTQLKSPDGPAEFPYSDGDISWMGGVVSLVATLSVLPLGYLVDRLGRRWLMLALAIPQLITWIMKLISTTPIVTILARGLSGISGAGVFIIIPLYVREISDESCRGALGSSLTLFTNLGVLFAYTLGAFIDYFTVLWIYAVIPIIYFILFLKAPETPAFLIKRNCYEEAAKTIAWLKSLSPTDPLVLQEVEKLKKEKEKPDLISNVNLMNIVRNPGTFATLRASMVLMFVQNMGGSEIVISYASLIFEKADAGISPNVQALITSLLQIVGGFIGICLVDRIGRKILLVIVTISTCISSISFATYFFLSDSEIQLPGLIPLLAAGLCVISYGAGLCSLVYVIITEMFDFETRATIIGYLTTFGWAHAFLVIYGFNPLANLIGIGGVFSIFAASTLFSTLYFILYLPETKGKSVEEIQKEILKK